MNLHPLILAIQADQLNHKIATSRITIAVKKNLM